MDWPPAGSRVSDRPSRSGVAPTGLPANSPPPGTSSPAGPRIRVRNTPPGRRPISASTSRQGSGQNQRASRSGRVQHAQSCAGEAAISRSSARSSAASNPLMARPPRTRPMPRAPARTGRIAADRRIPHPRASLSLLRFEPPYACRRRHEPSRTARGARAPDCPGTPLRSMPRGRFALDGRHPPPPRPPQNTRGVADIAGPPRFKPREAR
jgi:hypothetical protein